MDNQLPPKPKGMHWRTYDKLAARCGRYENIAKRQFFGMAVRLMDRLRK
jgi:hypothetical protein